MLRRTADDIEMGEAPSFLLRERDGPSSAEYHNFVENDEPLVVGVENLDRFLGNVYKYFIGKGFWSILLSGVVNLLQFGFTVLFATFLVSFVDYHKLLETQDWNEGIIWDIRRIHPFMWVVLVIAALFWSYVALGKLLELKELWAIRTFFHDVLRISERELHYMQWPQLVDKLTKVPRLCKVKETWTPLDIAQRIMRKENFLIALFNKEKLDLHFPGLPGLKLMTFLAEWSIKRVIFAHVFDSRLRMRQEIMDPETQPNSPTFLRLAGELKKQFRLLGIMLLIFSPFAFILLVLYIFFRYGEEVRSQPSFLSTRQWSRHAKWSFREFNELHHDFSDRLSLAAPHAKEYISQFPHRYVPIIARYVSFVVGAFVAVILIVAVFDDDFLQLTLHDKSMIWYLGIFGAILAICRSLSPKEHAVFKPEKHMEKVYKHTHYMPKCWRGRANTPEVLDQFSSLFEYRAISFVLEILSIFITPYLLMVVLPSKAEDILVFFRKYTRHIDGVGDICAYATFDLDTYGNPKYGAAVDQQHKDMQTKQGKMEKSFLNFKATYRTWEPPPSGKKMLMNLAATVLDPSRAGDLTSSKLSASVATKLSTPSLLSASSTRFGVDAPTQLSSPLIASVHHHALGDSQDVVPLEEDEDRPTPLTTPDPPLVSAAPPTLQPAVVNIQQHAGQPVPGLASITSDEESQMIANLVEQLDYDDLMRMQESFYQSSSVSSSSYHPPHFQSRGPVGGGGLFRQPNSHFPQWPAR